jgi:hypothetical protein
MGSSLPQQPGELAKPPGGFQITGTLVDAASGQPIVHARVAIAPVTQRTNFTTVVTGSAGRFLFTNLAPGKYTLAAQARGYLLQSFNGHERFSTAIAVGRGLDSTDLVFRLSPEGAISGVVSDEAGEPVANAGVILYFTGIADGIEATRQQGKTTTDYEGSYHFGHLPPGRYLAAVIAYPWYARNQKAGSQLDLAYPVTFYGDATDSGSAASIVLERGNKYTANIDLHAVPALHVRVPALAGRVGIVTSVLDGQPAPIGGRSDRNLNEVIFTVAPGRYIVRDVDDAASLAREVDIHDSELGKNQPHSYVAVRANVQFEAGVSLEKTALYLRLISKKTRQNFYERIAGQGEINVKFGVPPGVYDVGIVSNSGLFLKSLSATGATATGRTIEIRSSASVHLTISIARGEGQITGTASLEGKPWGGAMIVLVPADPVHNQILFVRDESDSDGTFTLSGVVPGNYTLLAIKNGWKLEWTKPSALKGYLERGLAVEVQPNGKYDLKVDVQ